MEDILSKGEKSEYGIGTNENAFEVNDNQVN